MANTLDNIVFHNNLLISMQLSGFKKEVAFCSSLPHLVCDVCVYLFLVSELSICLVTSCVTSYDLK